MFFLFKTNPKIPIKKSIIDKFIIILCCLKMCGYCSFILSSSFTSFENELTIQEEKWVMLNLRYSNVYVHYSEANNRIPKKSKQD